MFAFIGGLLVSRRGFMRTPRFSKGTEVSEFINEISELIDLSYLEIGIQYGSTFESVSAVRKVGVDPLPLFRRYPSRKIKIFKGTSDEFFSTYFGEFFDIVFIDGLHEFRQTWRDIKNATRLMNQSGIIIVDDVIPCDEYSALYPMEFALQERLNATGVKSAKWHGDVYKLLPLLSNIDSSHSCWTLVDFENPRVIIWSAKGNWDFICNVGDELIKKMDTLTYNEVFHEQDLSQRLLNSNSMTKEMAKVLFKKRITQRF